MILAMGIFDPAMIDGITNHAANWSDTFFSILEHYGALATFSN